MLAAAARACGAIAYRVGITRDDPEGFAEALSDQLVRADVVVTSGGVSMGAYDVVKEVLSEQGGVSFDQVAMQPGKPQGFGFVGEDDTPIFTLPGNPVSAYVSFEVFVVPALRQMMGRTPTARPMMRATATAAMASMPGRRQYARGRYEVTRNGATVTPVGGHGSHLIGDLADANALIVLGEQQSAVERGSAGAGAGAGPRLLMKKVADGWSAETPEGAGGGSVCGVPPRVRGAALSRRARFPVVEQGAPATASRPLTGTPRP